MFLFSLDGGMVMISIRYVKEEDKTFWFELDEHMSESELNTL